MRKRQLRWRREPRETGLRGVCQGTRGWELRYGKVDVGSVSIHSPGDRWAEGPWYWVASAQEVGIPLRNTACDGLVYETAEAAKGGCLAYVERHLIRD